ncbi:MAG TPA: hypothetical protein VFR58_05885 [Flavisolibacter sp.]|nr:hypothetical protein [Flavisolibacter sp.]
MRANRISLFLAVLVLTAFAGCSKTEEIETASLSDYLPLQVGKYITYRLDSTVFINFDRDIAVRSYQEKHVVDAEVTDAMGRTAFRVYRYLRDAAGTQDWTPVGSYFITPLRQTVELTENNLRIVKLALPLKKDFSWKGHQYLPDEPYGNLYNFNNDAFMSDWDFVIDSTDASFTYNSTTIGDVLRITSRDEDNTADTLTASGNQLAIPAGINTVYLRGTGTDTIRLSATPSEEVIKLYIYNRTNQPVKLDDIAIPVNGGKVYEYVNNRWTFGYVNDFFQRKDTLYGDLPIGSRDYGMDKYARGIGLVSQELIMWEFHPVSGNSNDGKRFGFGVKRTMIDHN